MPSAASVPSNALRASSGRWKPLLSLLVMYSSSRSRPEAATASPTPCSLPYISRGVDVPVADLERGAHRLRGLGRLDLEDAEPELGDRATVVEVDRRYGAHASFGSFVGGAL